MTGPDATASTTDDGVDEAGLPELSGVRPRSRTAEGDPAVVLRFENGARIRYRAADDGIREEWFDAMGDEPARSHTVAAVVPHDADGRDDVATGDRPDTRTLTDRALCTVSSYLNFDSRLAAEFAWGDANVAVLCDDPAESRE